MKAWHWLWLLPFCGFSQQQYEVFFDFNKDFPNRTSIVQLNQWIAANKSAEIIKVFGYCDIIDDSQYNKDLAARRINSVLELLRKDTISISKQVELKPLGKDFKLSQRQEENRKVTFFYNVSENSEPTIVAEPNAVLIEREVAALAAKFEKAKKGDLIRINNINFLFNSEKIEEASMPILEELLQILYDNPKLRIAIHGHICCNPNGMDTKLSYRRALVILKYLTKNEIPVNRLSFKGFGSNDPIYRLPERNEAERKANRRVEILIVNK